MRWFYSSPFSLFDEAGDNSGGGGSPFGIPHEHDDGTSTAVADGDDDADTRTPEAKRIAELEADLEAERAERKRVDADAKFWSDAAKKRATAAPDPDDEEPEPAVDPKIAETIARRKAMKPEDLLTAITERGADALIDLGFVPAEQLAEAIAQAEQRGYNRLQSDRTEGQLEARLAKDFPEMVEDSNRVARGEAPKSELFGRAGKIYRELVAIDPQLKGSRSLLLAAAGQAKAQLAAEGKGKGREPSGGDREERGRDRDRPTSRQSERRARIDAQRPGESRRDEGDGDEPSISGEAMHVAKMLGVSTKALTARVAQGRKR